MNNTNNKLYNRIQLDIEMQMWLLDRTLSNEYSDYLASNLHYSQYEELHDDLDIQLRHELISTKFNHLK